MSSDHITSVQTQLAARLQGSQQVSRAPEPHKAQPVKESPEIKGNESAASGEDLPLDRMDKSGERTRAVQVESAVSQISDLVFTIDKESDRLIVKVVDSATKEVIRQIPEEETLSIARHLDSPESLIIRRQA